MSSYQFLCWTKILMMNVYLFLVLCHTLDWCCYILEQQGAHHRCQEEDQVQAGAEVWLLRHWHQVLCHHGLRSTLMISRCQETQHFVPVLRISSDWIISHLHWNNINQWTILLRQEQVSSPLTCLQSWIFVHLYRQMLFVRQYNTHLWLVDTL